MVLLGDEAQVQASFGPFRDSANLDVDRCTVCAKHTIGSGIILDAPDGTTEVTLTQGWCTVCAERSIGSKIILDAPDGTPR